jgi:hypothetical protein
VSNIDEAMIKTVKRAVSDCGFGGVIKITAVILDPGLNVRMQGQCSLCGAIRAGFVEAGNSSVSISDSCQVRKLATEDIADETV